MVFVYAFGLVACVGLGLTVLLAMLLQAAARIDQAADLESALIWQEAEARALMRLSDEHRNRRSGTRVANSTPAAANA
jgi:hypothetical protein